MGRRQEEEQRQQQDTLERQKAAERESRESQRYSRDQPDTRSDTSSIRETTSRRSSTASEKKRDKSSARSKSPFRSFRFKKKSPTAESGAGQYSDEEENYGRALEASDGELEGMLVRKHEWESHSKKASTRSWDRICVVMKGGQIYFYKDHKSYKETPNVTFRGESPIDLLNGNAEVAHDYKKKKHVFRLRLANGGDYLFQAADQDQMNLWVTGINSQANPEEEAGARSQTLPPGSEKKDEPKRRSFFTLKKN